MVYNSTQITIFKDTEFNIDYTYSHICKSALLHIKIRQASTLSEALLYSSISLRWSSSGTGAYSANSILNLALPCVMDLNEEE